MSQPYELVLDSSAISSHLECPQKHSYEYIESIVKIDPDTGFAPRISDKIAAGTLGHKYLEIYVATLARTSGDQILAARAALDFQIPSDSLEYPIDPTICAKVKSRFGDYLIRYAHSDYTPAARRETRPGVIAGRLADIPTPVPLIEQGFSYVLLDTPEYYFVLEGRIDFIGSQHGELFFMDHKWQFREHTLYDKSVQFRNYALATGLYLGIVNYIRLHDKILPNTFSRQPLSFSAAEIAHWRAELIEIYIRIARELKSNSLFRNRFACAGRFGQHCQYIQLCDALNSEQRDFLKAQNFAYRTPWKPWMEKE